MSLVPQWLSQEWILFACLLLLLVLLGVTWRLYAAQQQVRRLHKQVHEKDLEATQIREQMQHVPFPVAAPAAACSGGEGDDNSPIVSSKSVALQKALNTWLDQQAHSRLQNAEAGTSNTVFEDVSVLEPPQRYRFGAQSYRDQSGQVQTIACAVDIQDLFATTTAVEEQAAELTAKTQMLQDLFDQMPIPLWLRGDDFTIFRCNQDYARVVGAAQPEAAAIEIESALTKGQAVSLAEAARKGATPQTETRYFVVEGQRRAMDIRELYLPKHNVNVGFAFDVTDREEIRAEINRFADAQAEILNNLNTAIVLFGADKTVSFYNSAYANLWRLDEDWLDRHPHHSDVIEAMRERRLLPEQADFPAYKARVMRMYTDLIRTEEGLMYRPDGRILRHLVAAHPLGGLLFIYEDITDRMRLEASYNTLIAVQRETLNSVFEGVAVFGGDGRLKLHNQAFAEMWGLEKVKLEDEPHVTDLTETCYRGGFFTVSDDAKWPQVKAKLIASVTERREQRGRMDLENGKIIEFAGVPLPDGNIVFNYLDVTDKVRIERALRERNEALETADRMKSEFIASVSYELRTPLNVIIGFTEVLEKELFGPLNERQKEYVNDILLSSQQLLSLINAILDLAVIEAGQLELETEPLDLYLVLDSVLSLNRQRAREQNLTLEFRCRRDIGTVDADERRLKQILFSLMSNAAKYNRAGGKIIVAAKRLANNEVAITVSDTGIGIKQEELTWVFERFQRGTTKGVRPGAGLGLSLVKSIVELHKGRVELQSEEGVGTTVTCILPARQPAADAAE